MDYLSSSIDCPSLSMDQHGLSKFTHKSSMLILIHPSIIQAPNNSPMGCPSLSMNSLSVSMDIPSSSGDCPRFVHRSTRFNHGSSKLVDGLSKFEVIAVIKVVGVI